MTRGIALHRTWPIALLVLTGAALTGCSSDEDAKPGEVSIPLLEGEVLSYSAPTEDSLYAVTGAPCRGCVDVWSWAQGDDEWEQVAELHDPTENPEDPEETDGEGPLSAAGLQMSTDGQHGYLNWSRDLWATDDGGATWVPLPAPSGVRQGQVVATTAGHAFHLGEGSCGEGSRPSCSQGALHRLGHGSETWQPVDLPATGSDPLQLGVRDGVVTLTTLRQSTSYLLRSRDEGETWTSVEAPRAPAYAVPGACDVYPSGVEQFVVACAAREGYDDARGYFNVYEVQSSSDGEEWTTLGEVEGNTPELIGITDDRFLLLGQLRGRGTRILEPDGSLTEPELPTQADDYLADVRFVSADVGYWKAGSHLLATADGGLSWQLVIENPPYEGE